MTESTLNLPAVIRHRARERFAYLKTLRPSARMVWVSWSPYTGASQGTYNVGRNAAKREKRERAKAWRTP